MKGGTDEDTVIWMKLPKELTIKTNTKSAEAGGDIITDTEAI